MKMRTEIAAGVAAAIMISLVGCGSSDVPAGPPEIEATDIAIVSGYHQNAVTPPINNSEILKAIEYSTRNNGSVTIVVNDGDPAAVVDFEIDESAVSGLSEARLEQQISEVIDSTNNALASSKANDPEVDTFEAIKQAARGLTGEAGDKCLYILDSGLSTEGELNVLSENLHRLIDVQPIVDKLQKDHALPDLTGVQVVWIGLGDAADKQEDLTSRNKNTLKELWEAVLTTSGAEVTFKNLPLTEEGSTDRELPEVTPIPIVHDSNDFDPLQVNQVKPLFNGDEATFVDRDDAVSELSPIVDYLLEHPDYTVILAGTTATAGTNEQCKELSLRRAEAVRQLMIDMGTSETQIKHVIGLGYLDCPHPPVLPNPVFSQQDRQLWYAGAAVSAAWACSCCPGSLGPPPAPLPRRAAGGPRPSASERWSAPFGARIPARRASRRQRPA